MCAGVSPLGGGNTPLPLSAVTVRNVDTGEVRTLAEVGDDGLDTLDGFSRDAFLTGPSSPARSRRPSSSE
jgi:hypothetical protein